MAYTDFVTLFFAIVVWCTAYITVAVLASLRAVNYLCTFWTWEGSLLQQFHKATMGYAQLVIGPAGSGKVIHCFCSVKLQDILYLAPVWINFFELIYLMA